MTLKYPLIDIYDAPPLPGGGQTDTPAREIRVGIGTAQGSGTVAWHLTSMPGAPATRHIHRRCDEIVFHLAGTGIAGQGEAAIATRPGLCRLIPSRTPHYFIADEGAGPAVSIGFLVGCGDLGDDFEGLDLVTHAPGTQANETVGEIDGLAVHLDDVKPENMAAGEGWSITDFRLPLGDHNGSSSTLFRARFFPGAIHKKHRHDHCDEIYYIISGQGLAGAGPDRCQVQGGQFHYIPSGVEHWLYNLSETEPIEVVGIYVGAGSVAATGYVYMGEVDATDLKQAR